MFTPRTFRALLMSAVAAAATFVGFTLPRLRPGSGFQPASNGRWRRPHHGRRNKGNITHSMRGRPRWGRKLNSVI